MGERDDIRGEEGASLPQDPPGSTREPEFADDGELTGVPVGTFPAPALITRTSGELLGKRPWPRVLTERPVLFVLGPREVGKTAVAARRLGPGHHALSRDGLRLALIAAARYRGWDSTLRNTPTLLLDDVDCLGGRFGAVDLLGTLLRERALAGRATVLCEGADTSVTLLYASLPLPLRATILLRFPVGRGRRRYVADRCAERGLDVTAARDAVLMEPWTYRLVDARLDQVAAAPPVVRPALVAGGRPVGRARGVRGGDTARGLVLLSRHG